MKESSLKPEITPQSFDRTVSPKVGAPRIIWTLPAIGARIGRGREFAAELAKAEDTPIRREGRQYYAFEDELIAYLRRA